MKNTEDLMEQRRNEIIDACEALYEEKGFHGITIKDISQKTSFSRPSIYNYFQTKEEIFLGLLRREYEAWTEDLEKLAQQKEALDEDGLASAIAHTLEDRVTLLKISAMNLYEIEENTRYECLVDFKKTFTRTLVAFWNCFRKFMPSYSDERIGEIRYAFFPFIYGIYPYVYPTVKQCDAMDEVGLKHCDTTIYDITYGFLKQIIHA